MISLRKLLLAVVGSCLLAITLHSGNKALAVYQPDGGTDGVEVFSNQTPPNNSGRYDPGCGSTTSTCYTQGTKIRPYYMVGNNSSDYTYSFMTLTVYVKKSSGLPILVNILNAAPDCHSTQSAGLVGPDYDLGSPPVTQYGIYGASGAALQAKASAGGGCGVIVQLSANSIQAKPMNTPTNDFDGYFNIRISIPNGAVGQGENSFQLDVNIGGAGYIGGSGVAGLGYRSTNLNNGNYWNAFTSFAAPVSCNAYKSGATPYYGSITYQDADVAHTDWNTNMIVELQSQQIDSADPINTSGPWDLVRRVVQNTNLAGFKMAQNGTVVSNFPFARDHRYRLVLANIGVRNTFRFDLSDGLDGVYANLSQRPGDNTCSNPVPSESDAVCLSVSPNISNPTVGQQVVLKVGVRNTGTVPWNTNYYMNQQSPARTDPKRFVQSNVAPGAPYTFTYTLGARSSPQSVTFTYQMFDDKGNKFTSPTPDPLCKITITWGNVPPQPNISAACGQTTVTIPKASIAATWHPPANTHTGAATKITKVPVAIVITESGTSNSFTYLTNVDISGGDGTTKVNTFGMWPAMLPHKSYDVKLAVQGTQAQDSLTYNNNGFWNPTNNANDSGFYYGINLFNTDTVSNCLHLAQCIGPSTADLEAGQRNDFTYQVQFTNDTGWTGPTNDPANYNFVVHTTGGLVYVGNATPSSTSLGTGASTVVVTIPIRSNFTGTYWVEFRYGGSTLSLDGSNVTCGAETGPGPTGQNTPHTFPYFQVTGGDIGTGGGFKSASGSCGAAGDTPYISPATTGNSYAGGIRAFGTPNKQRGSESEFGADTLGLIIGDISGPIGFFSADGAVFANKSTPTFTSIQGDGLYGYLNASPQAHCADEFMVTKQKAAGLPDSGAGPNVTTLPGGQYVHSGDVDINAGTIAAGKQLTLFVDGTVTIHGNINYAADWDPNDQSSIPYFVLVARNIILDNAVTQLDGLYVAQPSSADDGRFNSCDVSDFCNNQLVVNGAVIAQQVNLLRVHGSVGVNIDKDDDGICSPYPIVQCPPAEVIHYVPSMILGGADLLQASDGAIVPSGLEGIFSLPPVF